MALTPQRGVYAMNQNLTITDLCEHLDKAKLCLAAESATPEPHWYPCGFAWLAIKVRKNHRLSKTLQAYGFRWSDYEKCYQYRMPQAYCLPGMGQSMDYAARCLGAMAKYLKSVDIPCNVWTRID